MSFTGSFLLSFLRHVTVFIGVLFVTAACDELGVVPGDPIVLSTSRVVCFEFSNLTNNASKTVVSTDTIDLDAFLADQGFTKSEIIDAEARNISLRLRFPGQQDLSIFDRVSILLRAGAINTTIATSTNPGAASTINMPASGNDIGSILKATSFQAILDITGAATIQDDFLIEVEIEFIVNAEGL